MEGKYPTEYPHEKEELMRYWGGFTDGDVCEWLDETINRHRAQARAIAELDMIRDRGSWWHRNWPTVIILGMWVAGMLVIGLVNGWS